MRRLPFTCVPLLAAALLTACWQQPIETRLPTPNQNPQERYRVMVEVTNAPGVFERAEGFVLFQMTDDTRSCVPNQPNGAKAAATAGLKMPFALTKTSPTTFEGVAVLDQFVPNDDYGLGPCDWQTIGVDARLHNGINIHSADVELSLPGSGFEAGDERTRISDGLYRGRRAFRLGIWGKDRMFPDDPPRPADSPQIFSGGYDDIRRLIEPEDFKTYYFITVTAQRMDPSP
jgi:hypothetical protein